MKNKIKNLLKKYKIFPLKRLGQNFLINERILNKIIEVADIKKDDVILEVGPGIGNLTLELAKRLSIPAVWDLTLKRVFKPLSSFSSSSFNSRCVGFDLETQFLHFLEGSIYILSIPAVWDLTLKQGILGNLDKAIIFQFPLCGI